MTSTAKNLSGDDLDDPTCLYVGLMKERVAEKAEETQQLVDRFRVHMEVDPDSEKIRFSAQSSTGKIIIGLKGAARLMGHSYAYVSTHYRLVVWLQSLMGSKPEKLSGGDWSRSASQILAWAVTGDIRGKLKDYERDFIPEHIPDDILKLVDSCLPPKQQDIAGEIYANAIVWILYHELTHIQMGHKECEGLESLEQERQADRLAAEWMLDAEGIDPVVLHKRQLGIATALGWLTATTAFLGPGSRTTHPAAYDRLYQTLEQYIPREHEDVWLYVQVMLVLHLLLAGLTFDEDRIGPPFKENANYLIDVIANTGNK